MKLNLAASRLLLYSTDGDASGTKTVTEWFLLTSSSMIIREFNQWLYSPGRTRTRPPNAGAPKQRRIRKRLEVFIAITFTSNKCYNSEINLLWNGEEYRDCNFWSKVQTDQGSDEDKNYNMIIKRKSTELRWPRTLKMLQFVPKAMFSNYHLQKRFSNNCLKQ